MRGRSMGERTDPIRMMDVSDKDVVHREAEAVGRIKLKKETITAIREGKIKKGDPLTVAEIASIQAVKRTPDLIPLCHPIEIEFVDVRLSLRDDGVDIESVARCTDKTGIEMEALTAAAVAALTVYDMCKAVDKGMRIGPIALIEKTKEAIE